MSLDIVSVMELISRPLDGYWSWVALSGAALMASSAILAFMYVWGTLFRNNELVSSVKIEIYELFVTVFLIMFILAIAGSLSGLEIGGLLPAEFIPVEESVWRPGCKIETTDTVYTVTEVYFSECVAADFAAWLNLNYILNMYVDMAASITPYTRPMGIGLISAPLAGLASPLKQLLYNATTALTIAYIINYAQYYTFVFSMDVFLFYYLPIGVFLRSFVPTRRLGGTLIAVALSFLLVYPLLTTLSFILFYNDYGPMETFESFMTGYLETISFEDLLTRYANPEEYTGFSAFFTGPLGSIGTLIKDVFGAVFTLAMVFPISVVGKAFVIGYAVPAFNIMLFVQATISLSKSFGEEIDIGSLTRMI